MFHISVAYHTQACALAFPRGASSLARLPSALKSILLLNIPTEVLASLSAVLEPEIHVNKPDASARRLGTALEARHARRLGRPREVLHLQVADLELRVRAIAVARRAAEPGALRNGHCRATQAGRGQVLGGDIFCDCSSNTVSSPRGRRERRVVTTYSPGHPLRRLVDTHLHRQSRF